MYTWLYHIHTIIKILGTIIICKLLRMMWHGASWYTMLAYSYILLIVLQVKGSYAIQTQFKKTPVNLLHTTSKSNENDKMATIRIL